MKKYYLLAVLSLVFTLQSFSQSNSPISFDGLYIANAGKTQDNKLDIYTYLRFYRDGSVCLQAVNSKDPQAVNAWFGRYKTYSQKGTYQVKGNNITLQLDNKGTEDFPLEGLQETSYKGTTKPDNQLCLFRDKETKENCFSFYKVADTTTKKYSSYKPVIKLTGEWKVKQVLQGSRQVFFINDDSTIVGIAVLPADKLPFYKPAQSAFECTTAYYEWDSQYMRDEEKMEVNKIGENKEKSFITWHTKDKNNDNYYLFARHKDLLYNIMVFDKAMPLEKKLALLESLYDLNKE